MLHRLLEPFALTHLIVLEGEGGDAAPGAGAQLAALRGRHVPRPLHEGVRAVQHFLPVAALVPEGLGPCGHTRRVSQQAWALDPQINLPQRAEYHEIALDAWS